MTTATIDTREVREWATQNGHTVSTNGRIPNAVLEAYKEAHKGKRRSRSNGTGRSRKPVRGSHPQVTTEGDAKVIDLRTSAEPEVEPDTGPAAEADDAGRPTVFIVMENGTQHVIKPDAVYVDVVHIPVYRDEDTALAAMHSIERLPKGDLRTRLLKEAAGFLAG